MPALGTDIALIEREGVLHKATLSEIAALGGPMVTVGTSPPASPAVGDFWVDTN